MRSRRRSEPTQVSRVLEYLVRANDFVLAGTISTALGLTMDQVSAALHHLKKFKAIDYVQSQTKIYFFATPEEDTRTRILPERVPEPPGNRHRASGKYKRGPRAHK